MRPNVTSSPPVKSLDISSLIPSFDSTKPVSQPPALTPPVEEDENLARADELDDNYSMYTAQTPLPSSALAEPPSQRTTVMQTDVPSRSATPTPSSNNHLAVPPPSLAIESTESLVSAGSRSPNTEERTMNIVFAAGVRLGRPGTGKGTEERELQPASSQEGKFPKTLELSHRKGEDGEGADLSTWAIEADNWPILLRFLMWHGESRFAAGQQDIEAEESGHTGAAMVLQFRKDKAGVGVVRLLVRILPPNRNRETFSAPDFILAPNGKNKGKGKGRASPQDSSISQIIALPDDLPLPVSLNQISVILYTLRQLSSIALSTQATKDASASYHSLRTLGKCIQALAEERDALNKSDGEVEEAEETLYKKMKDRWKGVMRSKREKGSKTPVLTSASVPQ
ncbi:hypothetical protein BT69DRAFT_1010001 [Atractiella rhizophila]|nr:hypothetical protein BT69DRAFT_1010001 [Atractiella rhizophila]